MYDDAHRLSSTEVETLLRAAQWAPSKGNTQPWAVFVTTARVRASDEPDAPAYSDHALYDVGQAAAHLTLQAGAMGLHAHQFAGFDHDALAEALGVPATHRVLTGIAVGVPGDPAEVDERTAARDRRDRSRRPLEEWVFGERFGEPFVTAPLADSGA